MTLGFTGTSQGMTQRQQATVRYLFSKLVLTVLHHGDCVGADAQAHQLAIDLSAQVIIHPPSDPKLRAFCAEVRYYSTDEIFSRSSTDSYIRPPKTYLARNRDIVKEGVDGIIGAPKDFMAPTNLRGQGTWTTIGYARKAKRRLWIVVPDGTFREEQP